MDFEQLWEIIEKKNPSLSTGKISMSSDNFKKAMLLAYEQGRKENPDKKNFSADWLSDIFNMKK